MIAPSRHIDACRFCGGALSIPFCDLGKTPLANSYVDVAREAEPDPVFRLNAVVCARCFLVQLDEIVDPTGIFVDYAYFSSYSSSSLAHAAAFAHDAMQKLGLDRNSLVVEIASNDGYLLKNFVAAGIPCLGVEPAANVAAAAEAIGVPTRVAFFGQEVANEIVAERGHASLVVANNVLAHVPDINDFVAGLSRLAGPSGVVSIEVPHLMALVDQVQFDTIYHEHYAYWSLHAMSEVLKAHGLKVFDVEILPTHGTSLRVFAAQGRAVTGTALDQVRASEATAGITNPAFYRGFQGRVGGVIDGFRAFLVQVRGAGRRLAAYGAAAKGNTFLNAAGTTAADIEAVGDLSTAKQGRLLPGSRIPIVSPQELLSRRPDDVIVLPWNLADEVARDLAAVKTWGGRLLVAVPCIREL
jgi:SAM-dependent methyltransferase